MCSGWAWEIARVLGVAYVVEGSVRRSDDKLRVTAQLIRATDGFHLWSESYDRAARSRCSRTSPNIARMLDVHLDEAQREEMFASGPGRDPARRRSYR